MGVNPSVWHSCLLFVLHSFCFRWASHERLPRGHIPECCLLVLCAALYIMGNKCLLVSFYFCYLKITFTQTQIIRGTYYKLLHHFEPFLAFHFKLLPFQYPVNFISNSLKMISNTFYWLSNEAVVLPIFEI